MGIGQRGPTGSLANERGRAKMAGGAPACFLSGISGWFSLSLGAWVPKNLARRSLEVWLRRRVNMLCHPSRARARFSSTLSAGALRLDRLGPPGRCRLLAARWRARRRRRRRFRCSAFRFEAGAATLSATGSASPRPDRNKWLGGSGVLSLRHFGLVLFIPWRVGAEESGAAKFGSMASAPR